ncbi:MAG: serine/threonine protein kinase [Archangiaceae bacterium]|nr:serine/threonine protein kinase [Archangiaceae bacterium]
MTVSSCSRCGSALAGDECRVCAATRSETPGRLRDREVTRIQALGIGALLAQRWRITGILRAGPLSTVYLADDTAQQQPAVVKTLTPELCRDPEAVIRFDRECRALEQLTHPHLVPLSGAGWRGVTPWIAMPRLSGTTLAQLMDARRLSQQQVLFIARQLGAALTFVHEQGLVHRDVKPGNVFVSEAGHVTLLDLGLAHDVTAPLLTRPGQKLGTVAYMAPEQIDGPGVDARTDVYALGVVLFELLTGALPFDGADHEILRAHQVAAPPDAHQRDASVPAGLALALKKALAKAPDDRFQTVEALISRVQLFLEAPATAPLR